MNHLKSRFYEKKLNNKTIISTPYWDSIFASLLDLSDKSAKTVIYDAFYELK